MSCLCAFRVFVRWKSEFVSSESCSMIQWFWTQLQSMETLYHLSVNITPVLPHLIFNKCSFIYHSQYAGWYLKLIHKISHFTNVKLLLTLLFTLCITHLLVQSGKVVVIVTVNDMQNMLEYVAFQTGSDQTTFSFVGSVSCAPFSH